MANLNDLEIIMRYDPDGWESEPTATDYAAFERWVISTYGQEMWDVYRAGGWGEDQSVGDWSHHYEYDEY